MDELYIAQTESTPNPQHIIEKPKNKFIKWAVIIIAIFLLLIIGSGTFLLSQKSQPVSPTENQKNQRSQTLEPSPILTPTVSGSPESKTNQENKSNWNTFTSSDNAYSLRYPSDGSWKMTLSPTENIICPPASCPKSYNIFSFTIKKTAFSSIEQFVASLNTTNPNINTPNNPYIIDYELITVNGLAAVTTLNPSPASSETGPTVSVFIIIEGVGYLYSYTYIDPSLNSATTLDELPDPNPNILSTIQFGNLTTTTTTTTNGWNEYTNLTHGIKLKYPTGWFVNGGKNINTCIMFSNSSDPNPAHSHTIISLCSYPNESLIINTGSDKLISVNGNQGIKVKQTSNWGTGEKNLFSNPKGGSTAIEILIGDANIFRLMVSTLNFIK